MSRTEYMRELDALLQGISKEKKQCSITTIILMMPEARMKKK